MTDRELMQMALDALEKSRVFVTTREKTKHPEGTEWYDERIEALRARLAQPEPEPVAWMHIMDNTEGIEDNGTGIVSITQKRKHPFGKPGIDFSKSYPVTSTPLYTAPPQREWQGLTGEEIMDSCSAVWASHPIEVGRVVEEKLKEKNS